MINFGLVFLFQIPALTVRALEGAEEAGDPPWVTQHPCLLSQALWQWISLVFLFQIPALTVRALMGLQPDEHEEEDDLLWAIYPRYQESLVRFLSTNMEFQSNLHYLLYRPTMTIQNTDGRKDGHQCPIKLYLSIYRLHRQHRSPATPLAQ